MITLTSGNTYTATVGLGGAGANGGAATSAKLSSPESLAFDKDGNYNIGITEQLIFPEINYEDIDQTKGLDINIVTTANTKVEGKALLKALGFPFND